MDLTDIEIIGSSDELIEVHEPPHNEYDNDDLNDIEINGSSEDEDASPPDPDNRSISVQASSNQIDGEMDELMDRLQATKRRVINYMHAHQELVLQTTKLKRELQSKCKMIDTLKAEVARSNKRYENMEVRMNLDFQKDNLILPRKGLPSRMTIQEKVAIRKRLCDYINGIDKDLFENVNDHSNCKERQEELVRELNQSRMDLDSAVSALDKSRNDLKELNEKMGNEYVNMTCQICFSARREIASLGCGHIVACRACWIRTSKDKAECPICRQPTEHWGSYRGFIANGCPVNLV